MSLWRKGKFSQKAAVARKQDKSKNILVLSSNKDKYIKKSHNKPIITSLFLKKFLLVIYNIIIAIEKSVSYANKKGLSKVWTYISTFFTFIGKLIYKGVILLQQLIRNHFKIFISATSSFIVITAISVSSNYALAVKVNIDDSVVGYVNDQSDFVKIKENVENDISQKTGDSYLFEKIPVYSVTVVKKSDLSSSQEVYNSLYKTAEENLGQTYGVFVDGELIAACQKEGKVQDMLEGYKMQYASGAVNEKVEFINNVEIVKGMYSRTVVKDIEEINDLFTKPSSDTKYTVLPNQSATTIAKNAGLTVTELKMLNPNVNINKLTKGQKLNVSKPAVTLKVKVIKTITYNQDISYQVVKTPTADLFEGTTKVKVSGAKGSNQITAEVTTVNGEEINREIKSTKTVKQPVTQQLLVGTKKVAPSGTFIWPISSRNVSSGFGYRWGRMHPAVDFAAPRGTAVVASDAGTVIEAGWDSYGLGNYVKISHGNGVTTRYGHLNSIAVTKGQKVYQGQVIGHSGSTGFSTGPHLHFELVINGQYVNPLNYIR